MSGSWFLEGIAADGSHSTHTLDHFPFKVGREPGNDLEVPARGLSRRHAEFSLDESGRLRLNDLESLNGTFVNRERISGSCLVDDNDVIHFGNAEFRLGLRTSVPDSDGIEPTMMAPKGQALSGHFVRQEREFMELLQGRGLSGAIQPIVDARSGELFAYELLGRAEHPDLPKSPIQLFSLAAALDREAQLSEAFRNHGIRAVAASLAGTTLFVNTHPKETFEDGFLAGLARLPAEGVPIHLVVEVHETAVMEIERMRELAARLKEIGMRFAYDDFGAGQSRIAELAKVPPHFVKFDMGLIRNIDKDPAMQDLVGVLVEEVHKRGSIALAEGVESEEEAVVCRRLGFDLIQGYLTGRPVPIPDAWDTGTLGIDA